MSLEGQLVTKIHSACIGEALPELLSVYEDTVVNSTYEQLANADMADGLAFLKGLEEKDRFLAYSLFRQMFIDAISGALGVLDEQIMDDSDAGIKILVGKKDKEIGPELVSEFHNLIYE